MNSSLENKSLRKQGASGGGLSPPGQARRLASPPWFRKHKEEAPMSAVADRNLLFGILALQLDFISRDQLVEAMHAWVLAKQRPLGEILVERGALASDDHALLAPMVERHIAKHGGDPAKSLAV